MNLVDFKYLAGKSHAIILLFIALARHSIVSLIVFGYQVHRFGVASVTVAGILGIEVGDIAFELNVLLAENGSIVAADIDGMRSLLGPIFFLQAYGKEEGLNIFDIFPC